MVMAAVLTYICDGGGGVGRGGSLGWVNGSGIKMEVANFSSSWSARHRADATTHYVVRISKPAYAQPLFIRQSRLPTPLPHFPLIFFLWRVRTRRRFSLSGRCHPSQRSFLHQTPSSFLPSPTIRAFPCKMRPRWFILSKNGTYDYLRLRSDGRTVYASQVDRAGAWKIVYLN